MAGFKKCTKWADQGSFQCSVWADKGSLQCSVWADEGSSQCQEWADNGYNQCCTWIPCKYVCSAFYWVANWVCKAYYWVAKWVCKAYYWVAKWVCKAYYWVAKWVCVTYAIISESSIGRSIQKWAANAWIWLKSILSNLDCNTAENPIEKSGWQLTFSDEFVGTAVDLLKWRTIPGFTTPTFPYFSESLVENNTPPKQFFSPLALSVNNSILTIETTEVSGSEAVFKNILDVSEEITIPYRTGWIESIEFTQQYGFFEIRCKLPKSNGAMPAFWLFCNHPDPWPPEVDIFEYYRSGKKINGKKSTLHTNIHWGTKQNHHQKPKMYFPCDPSKNFNTYGFEWTPEYMKWYFNNQEVRKEELHMEEFVYKFKVVINGGMEDYQDDPNALDGMVLPHKFEVDYVRVYKQ